MGLEKVDGEKEGEVTPPPGKVVREMVVVSSQLVA